jgi:hypothetical protein
MLESFKELIARQYEAAFCTLNVCIDRCPDANWNLPVANLKFCQVAFHTLFFADYYLGTSPAALRLQKFHPNNAHVFRDYEELEDRRQQLLYERADVKRYLAHCRNKAREVIGEETADVLAARCGFPPKTVSRAELHVYNLRHLQHHAAQLSLRLRLDAEVDVPWIGSGWRE